MKKTEVQSRTNLSIVFPVHMQFESRFVFVFLRLFRVFTTVSIPQPSEKLGHIVCSMVVDVQDGRGLLRDSPHWFQLIHIEGTCTAISQNLGGAPLQILFEAVLGKKRPSTLSKEGVASGQ